MPNATEAVQLVEAYLPLAMRIANRWAEKWPWLRDDFASAAGWALWRAAMTHNPERGRFAAFVHVAVRRKCYVRLKQEFRKAPEAFRRQSTDPEYDPLNHLADDSMDAAGQMEAAEEIDLLLKATTPDARAAIELHFLDGIEVSEIADAKGVCRASVQQSITRGLRKMCTAATQ
ncbi:MAG TPA: sigma-70 family RNA polymerase sigma factor [Urbifossiella sp.]